MLVCVSDDNNSRQAEVRANTGYCEPPLRHITPSGSPMTQWGKGTPVTETTGIPPDNRMNLLVAWQNKWDLPCPPL
jgi:hypothetical protein